MVSDGVKPYYSSLFIQFVQRKSLMGQLDKWHYTHIVMVSDGVKTHFLPFSIKFGQRISLMGQLD